jgi:hypothetical protein
VGRREVADEALRREERQRDRHEQGAPAAAQRVASARSPGTHVRERVRRARDDRDERRLIHVADREPRAADDEVELVAEEPVPPTARGVEGDGGERHRGGAAPFAVPAPRRRHMLRCGGFDDEAP